MGSKPSFDAVKIAGYVLIGVAALSIGALNSILAPWGLTPSQIQTISLRIGSIGAAATTFLLIMNAIRNPSPPPGTISAVIPQGTMPVVAPSPGDSGEQQHVAHVDPTLPTLSVTRLTQPITQPKGP